MPVFKCVASSLVFPLSLLCCLSCAVSLLFHSLHAFSFCYSSLVACLRHGAHVNCHDKTLGPKSKDSSQSHLDLPSSLTVHVSARVSPRFTFVLIHLLSRLCSSLVSLFFLRRPSLFPIISLLSLFFHFSLVLPCCSFSRSFGPI